MANVKFGSSQLKNPTPSNWGNAVKVFTVIGGIVIGWIGTANFIPANTSSILQSILGLLLSIANGILPFFGVETDQKKIPIEDVASMDVKDSSTKP